MRTGPAKILPNGWLPISTADKNGSIVVAQIRNDLVAFTGRADLDRWQGVQVFLRHSGIAENGFDIGWNVAAPVGHGGIPDSWIAGWRRPEPAPWEPSVESPVRRFLDLSTGHLRIETRERMDRGGEFGDDVVLIFDPHGDQGQYGWWLWAGRRGQDDMVEKLPADLRAVVEHARNLGCDWICFDRDAEAVAELPVYSDSPVEQLRFERRRGAILAGLRLLQAGGCPPIVEEIGEGRPRLSAAEIDALCQTINLMDAEDEIEGIEDAAATAVLAGLRLLQLHQAPPAEVYGVATDDGRIEPLDADEIDELCEWINLGPDRAPAGGDPSP